MFAVRKPGHRGQTGRRWSMEALERRDMLSGAPTVVNVEVASTSWSSAFVEFLQDNDLGTNGYAIPVGSSAQSCSLTWTGIDQIIITFSEDVHVDAADLSLSGINSTAYAFSNFKYDPQSRVAVWTLASPVFIDRLQIDLDADGADPVRNLDGVALDGNWLNGVSVYAGSGSTPGVDFQFTFNVLPADINNSGTITTFDYRYVYQSRGNDTDDPGYIVFRDIDGDGDIDSVDWQVPVSLLNQALPSGTPAGVTNDAPTVSGLSLAQVPVGAHDLALSLLYGFDDAEDGASGLTFSIVNLDNSALAGGSYIDPLTKSLVVEAAAGMSGRANFTIRATDTGGLFVDTTLTVDVGYQNQAPSISAYNTLLSPSTWLITGQLYDWDDSPEDFIMNLSGAFSERFTVQENGEFECVIIVPSPTALYEVQLTTADPHGAPSNTVHLLLGLT
jgi:hypothetical protein